MTDTLFGVPLEKLSTLARQIQETKDSWAKLSPMDNMNVSWGDRHPPALGADPARRVCRL